MAARVQLSVVIPTHNRVTKLGATLDRLADQTMQEGWEVIVVANNCEDDTVRYVSERSEHFLVDLSVMEESTPGASAARNAGARHARGGDLLFIDDDILLELDCLERLFADRSAHPDAWFLGQAFPLPEHRATPFGTFRDAAMPPVSTSAPITEVQWFSSQIALIPRPALLNLGGYEEQFTTAALEDADLAIRARRAGHHVLFDPAITSLHDDWAGTSLQDYCRRQRVYSATAPLLDELFGTADHPWGESIVANRPPVWGQDRPIAIAKKLVRHVLGTSVAQVVLLRLADALERRRAPSAILWPVYRAAISGASYGGYRSGLPRHHRREGRTRRERAPWK